MADKFSNIDNVDSAARQFKTLTPSDATDIADVPKALYFNTAGTVSLIGADDLTNTPVVFSVAAQQVLYVRPKRIRATGTSHSAGDIIGLY